jgi:nitroreductase
MELIDAINRRRTVRDFSSESVPAEIIEKALNAGLKAPSYNHLKEWHFILVKDRVTRLALTETEVMTETVTDKLKQSLTGYDALAREMYLNAIPKQRKMLLSAPELLIVVYKPKTQVSESERVYDLNCLASVWCCIENVLLSLAENNVFGVTFIPQNTHAVKQVLHIPQELEVTAMIPFGYKAPGAGEIPQKDAPLDSRLHRDRW